MAPPVSQTPARTSRRSKPSEQGANPPSAFLVLPPTKSSLAHRWQMPICRRREGARDIKSQTAPPSPPKQRRQGNSNRRWTRHPQPEQLPAAKHHTQDPDGQFRKAKGRRASRWCRNRLQTDRGEAPPHLAVCSVMMANRRKPTLHKLDL